ncbi:MAG: ABC transporter ATP-binding protein [Clostridia bacterium]|nr:ABC transporter ATP-binding protein [Clostridia bacterium]
MSALTVKGLNKKYEKFELKDVTFHLDEGYIMGFIGSNGAGKTTTLKAILNMIQINGGEVHVFGQDFSQNEMILKQDIGYMLGGVDFYIKKKIKTITDVVKRFYTNWDDDVYNSYKERFNLDEDKKISELSDGMKVKYSLTLALSHNAKLFILDEPTSGLDPVARDNLLELFQELVEDGKRSILFSTHITSDLEKCADYITYINNGEIIESSTKEDLINSYRIVKGSLKSLQEIKEPFISYKTNAFGFSGLIRTDDLKTHEDISVEAPNLEDIMIYYAKRENKDD